MAQAEPSNVTASCRNVAASTSMSPASQSGEYVTAGMSEAEISAAIEKSKEQGWTEVAIGAVNAAASSSDGINTIIWEELKARYPCVFRQVSKYYDVKLGRLLAEGGQAHIYEAEISGIYNYYHKEWVAKVFKMEGFSLAHLKRQWPLATKTPIINAGTGRTFVLGAVVFGEDMDYCSWIHSGTFLRDGRFAYVMKRYWGDFQTLMDLRLSDNNSQWPPFPHRQAVEIMYEVASGMEDLHERSVLHRDHKAVNVLICTSGNDPWRHDVDFSCEVADYESSMMVQGIGFWRAPEVLEELLKKGSDGNAGIWTGRGWI